MTTETEWNELWVTEGWQRFPAGDISGEVTE